MMKAPNQTEPVLKSESPNPAEVASADSSFDAALRFTEQLARIRTVIRDGAPPLLRPVVEAIDQLIDAWRLLHVEARAHEDALRLVLGHASQIDRQVEDLVEMARELAASFSARSLAGPTGAGPAFCPPAPPAIASVPDPSGLEADEPLHPPVLTASVLGPFQVQVNAQAIDTWPTCRARSMFEYLLMHRRQPVPKEVLMELFWPDGDPEARRNSLNVAVHRLRRLLARFEPDFPFIPFANDCYSLNPQLVVQTDADAFVDHARRAAALDAQGNRDAARAEYDACRALYRQELLAQNRGDDWVLPLRQQWRDRYLAVLRWLSRHAAANGEFAECAQLCAEVLAVDPCHEEAHRELIRAYAALGQPDLVQTQYRNCVKVLSRELGIAPSAETTALYREVTRSGRQA